jgi:hypothetical protein
MRTLRSHEHGYAREDAYRGYGECDYQRHLAYSPQQAPRRRGYDSERDEYPGRHARHQERRSAVLCTGYAVAARSPHSLTTLSARQPRPKDAQDEPMY